MELSIEQRKQLEAFLLEGLKDYVLPRTGNYNKSKIIKVEIKLSTTKKGNKYVSFIPTFKDYADKSFSRIYYLDKNLRLIDNLGLVIHEEEYEPLDHLAEKLLTQFRRKYLTMKVGPRFLKPKADIKPKLIFTESALPFILEAFNLTVRRNFIVNAATWTKIRDINGETIKLNELAAIDKGKDGGMIFVKGDLYSLMKYTDGKSKH